jgi:hypothetical protein
LGKALLTRYEWWRFEPHPEWAEPHWTEKDYMQPYAAGIPGELRMVYAPASWNLPRLAHLETNVVYQGFLFNPSNGKEVSLGEIRADEHGKWQPPVPPIVRDWAIVLRREGATK